MDICTKNSQIDDRRVLPNPCFQPDDVNLDPFTSMLCPVDTEEGLAGSLPPIYPSLSAVNWQYPTKSGPPTPLCPKQRERVSLPPLATLFLHKPASTELVPSNLWLGGGVRETMTNSSFLNPAPSTIQCTDFGFNEQQVALNTSVGGSEWTVDSSIVTPLVDLEPIATAARKTCDHAETKPDAAKGKISKRKNVAVKEKGRSPNVNMAFKKLRTLIPTEPADRRLSKVETLRLAVSYIQHLAQTLNYDHWVEQPCLSKIQDETTVCTFCMRQKQKKKNKKDNR
ncbi:unnamed protein product [Clavelina lepadiformis]|uniref:BHLH domain-containing protein n=1 Tax=Clavelina lepadiformis TaxID=159417 RepID=A0ABP0FUI7_CLALP